MTQNSQVFQGEIISSLTKITNDISQSSTSTLFTGDNLTTNMGTYQNNNSMNNSSSLKDSSFLHSVNRLGRKL